ncbi:MAG: sigma-70 family RNA polymerase sigma factor [Phycisphaerales bacterium]
MKMQSTDIQVASSTSLPATAQATSHATSEPAEPLAEPLMQLIAQGDTEAMRRCIEKYKGLVNFLARRSLRSAGDDIENAVQDAFVELWRSAPLYDPTRGSEATFITMITRSSLRDAYRLESRRPKATLQDELSAARGRASNDRISAEDSARVRAAFNSLEDEDRQILRCALHRGMSLKRIAKCENIPLRDVQRRVRHALSHMRSALRQDGTESMLASVA